MHAFPYMLLLAPAALALYGVILWLSRRSLPKDVICPVDGEPRRVVFYGHAVESDQWEEVLSCQGSTQPARVGNGLTCARACLRDPSNAPRLDLARRRPR